MIEFAAMTQGVPPPEWTGRVPPLYRAWFGTDLGSLRLHLLNTIAGSVPASKRLHQYVRRRACLMEELSKGDIRQLFDRLNAALARTGIVGEVYLVGGAVMCLVLDARPTTKDVGAFLHPASEVREAARRIDVGTDWLNDTVTGYLSERGEFHACPELPNLRVLTAALEHLPAMKCMAMRMVSEFHDIDDVRFLLRCLNLTELDAAPDIISRHDPDERITQKTIHMLGDMFAMDTPEHRNRAEGPSC